MVPGFRPLSSKEVSNLQAHLLDFIDQALVAVTVTGDIVFWNRSAERVFGWAAREVMGKNLGDLLESRPLKRLLQEYSGSDQQGPKWSEEFRVARLNSGKISASFGLSMVFNGPRVLVGMISLSVDGGSEHHQLLEANRLLSEAGALLSDSLDYEDSLRTLAQLAVPQVADWCAVHLLKDDGSIEQVALAPVDVIKVQAAEDWLQKQLPVDEVDGLPAVFRSGEPKLVTDFRSNRWAAQAAIQSYLMVPLLARPQIIGAITFVTAESGRRLDKETIAVAENLASHIAVYLEKARMFRHSQELNVELEHRVDERTFELRAAANQLKESEATIQTLFRISNNLNSTLDIATILEELALEAIRIVDADSGFAGLCTSEGMVSTKYFRKGTSEPFEHLWASGAGVPGWVLEHKNCYLANDAANDPLVEHDLSINVGVRSMVCIPIVNSLGVILGYFDIRNKKGIAGFSLEDQDRLLALAPSASIAIQNALAYQQRLADLVELDEASRQLQALAANLETAREQERIRIARDLHDELGQALTAMKFDLAWLAGRLEQKDLDLAAKAKAVTEQMDLMIKTVRRIATELRPGMLDDLGLAASIEWQSRDFEKNTGILCSVTSSGEWGVEQTISAQSALAVFRIFQEAMTNIARHSGARNVDIDISETAQGFVLRIHDDGRGISNPEARGRTTLGLLGMRERAHRLGGSVAILGSHESGTFVTVTVPREKV